MGLADLADQVFGPRPLSLSRDRVSDFVEVTGDDDRWTVNAPPGFAAAALFVVAPELLDRLGDRFVVHGEQTFTWEGPLVLGQQLDVEGHVTRVRDRGGVTYVGFDIVAHADAVRVLEGSSLFLVTEPAEESMDPVEEPSPSDRGSSPNGQKSASRADLVRYAAATGDWNPIHWDHGTARAAGLPGVVVHGLLQASWAFVEASRLGHGPAPLLTARVRFRNPLRPAQPVSVSVSGAGDEVTVSVTDEEREYLSARVEVAGG